MVGTAKDESGKVPDEKVVKLAFVVGDHQQVDMMFHISVIESVECEKFIVFVYENVSAEGGVYVLEFRSAAKFKRRMEFIKVFSQWQTMFA